MKKIFYGFGAVAAIATPAIAVVSCGSSSTGGAEMFKGTIEGNKFIMDSSHVDFNKLDVDITDQSPENQQKIEAKLQIEMAPVINKYLDFLNAHKGKIVVLEIIPNEVMKTWGVGAGSEMSFTVPQAGFHSYAEYENWIDTHKSEIIKQTGN